MAGPTVELSAAEARRIALRAQGFGVPRPAKPTRGHLRRMLARLGSLQVDAVNVLERAHYLPAFSRFGPYDRAMLDDLVYERGQAFEYLTHAASVVDTAQHPWWRWRMERHATEGWWERGRRAVEARQPGYVERVLAEIDERGPLSFRDLTDPARRERAKTKYAESSLLWWPNRPSDGKFVLEGLWRAGVLAVAGRTPSFERIFDRTERVLPPVVLDQPTPSVDEAHRALAAHALSALGVAWVSDVADYHRLKMAPTRRALRSLATDGRIHRAQVEGLDGEAYMDAAARSGRALEGAALLGPFDSLLWERARNVRLLGFTHSFEIYVPEAKRRFGYYVLPFLLGESIAARVDLKADRSRATLIVQAAHLEPNQRRADVVGPLAAELRTLARWLELGSMEVRPRGDLARALAAARP